MQFQIGLFAEFQAVRTLQHPVLAIHTVHVRLPLLAGMVPVGASVSSGGTMPPAQPFQNLHAGAVQPGLDGTDRPFQNQSNLLVRLPLLVEQNKDIRCSRQLGQSRLDLVEQFAGVVGGGAGDGVLEVVNEFGSPNALRQPGSASIDGDADDPGFDGARVESQPLRLRKTRRNTSWVTSSASCRRS